jgi:hypothetical protein
VAERSREAHQQAKISIDMSTEALLKAYEVATLAASISRQSWKMCITLSGPDMPARTKEAEKRPDTTGRYLAQTLFGVTLKEEEVAISHFRGAQNEYIIKFTRTGYGTSHEDLLHASKALGRNRVLQVYAKIAGAEADSEIYFLLRCMVKAGEAESCYTARSGRPAAWLVSAVEDGVSAPYSFGTVMEVRALMGPAARKEETSRMEGSSQPGRRKRALTREAVGSGLKEAVRDMGLAEDVVRDEAREKGIVQGGGIRWKEKADISIFRGIKMDSVPAWADYGGRGRAGGRGTVMGARGSRAEGGGVGSRGRGGRGIGDRGGRGGGRGVGDRGRGGSDRGRGVRGGYRGRGRGRGSSQQVLSGSNVTAVDLEAPADRKRKAEDKAAEEAKKKVRLMELASPTSEAAPTSASSSLAASSSAASVPRKSKSKSLINILMSGHELDVARGYNLFDGHNG